MANSDQRMSKRQRGCRMRLVVLILAASSAVTHGGVSAQSAGSALRPFQVDDVFALQQLGNYYGPIEFAPDGQQVAFVVQRPMPVKRPIFQIFGYERADIYVASSSGGAPTNVTKGEADGSGYWAPDWSPDGRRLAMLSTKSGALGLWVWERESDSPRRMTFNDVDLYPTFLETSKRPFVWLSPTHLLATLMPKGKAFDAFKGEWRGGDKKAAINWERTWAGEEVSASVLTSGLKTDQRGSHQSELTIIDVNTGETQVVGRGAVANFAVAKGGNILAYARRVGMFKPQAEQPLPFIDLPLHDRFELVVATLERTNGSTSRATISDVVPTSLAWSPDGGELGFLAYTPDRQAGPQLCRFNGVAVTTCARSQSKNRRLPPEIIGRQLHWTPDGWLVLGSARHDAGVTSANSRRDWWLARDDGSFRCATQSMSVVPSQLWREASRNSFVGLADGKLWRISGELMPSRVSVGPSKRLVSIVWPSSDGVIAEIARPGVEYGVIVVLAGEGLTQDLYSVNLATGRASLIRKPGPGATIIDYSPRSQAAAYYSNDRTGLRLWLSRSIEARPFLIFEANTFLKEIAAAQVETLRYKTLNGESQTAWLLLPPGYQRGRRYPMVVWPYPGYVAGPSPGTADDIGYVNFLNRQILTAKGYAVLRPSTPLNPIGQADDMLLKLKATVLPAVDMAIHLGIADSDKIYLLGHSYGGYAVYGLVTEVNRFKAAVAINGYTDLISAYGEFHFGRRYEDDPLEGQRWMQAAIEVSMHLGGPPWQDLERYMRNSPIFYVDRVQTPLLIIHGDLDAASIEQAEEFFSALYRQDKPAKFVRYWGEGHNLQSLPNIRDMWSQIFDWFDNPR